MGWFSRIGDSIKKAYESVDRSLGGRLPGGVPKAPSKPKDVPTSTVPTAPKVTAPVSRSPISRSPSSGGGGGGASYPTTGSKGYTFVPGQGFIRETTQEAVARELNKPKPLTPSSGGGGGGSVTLNPQTGKPYGTVAEAPTQSQAYKQSIAQYGLVPGSLHYLGERTSGKLTSSKLSPVRYSGYSAPVGKLASTSIQTAPYFTPLGGGLAFVAGAEAVGTKRGRSRIGSTSQTLKESYGIPTYVSTPAQYGLAVGGIVFGGSQLNKQISKLAGYPKYSTTVVGASSKVSKVGKLNKITTKVATETGFKKTILSPSKTYYGRSTTTSYFTRSPGKITGSQSITKGAIARFTRTGEPINQQQFNVLTGSVQKPARITATAEADPFRISRSFKGSVSLSSGRSAIEKAKKIYIAPKKEQFTSLGVSIDQGRFTFVGGATRRVVDGRIARAGKGVYQGVLIKPSPQSIPGAGSSVVSSGAKSSQEFLNKLYTKSFQEGAVASQSAVRKATFTPIKTTGGAKIVPVVSAKSSIKTISANVVTPTTSQGIKQSQLPKVIPIVTPFVATTTKKITKIRTTSISVARPLTIPRQGQPTAIIPFTPTITRQINILRPGSPPGYTETPIKPVVPPIIPPFKFPSLDLSTGISKRRIGVRRYRRYTPSFSALIFKIRGSKPKGVETGLRLRPIPRGFKWF